MTHDEFIDFLKDILFNCTLAQNSLPLELCYLIISYLPRADIIGKSDIKDINKIKDLCIQILSPTQYISSRLATVFSTIVCYISTPSIPFYTLLNASQVQALKLPYHFFINFTVLGSIVRMR